MLDGPLASHIISKFESKFENSKFARVDADTLDKLIEKTEVAKSNLTEDQEKDLTLVLEQVIEKEKYQIQFEALNEKENPVVITQPEFMRRMKEQSLTGGGGMYG